MTYEEAADDIREWLAIRASPGHFSNILVRQLAKHLANRTLHVFSVLDEIGKLQGTWRGKSLGKPEQFKHRPLLGLWKQHFFEPRNMVQNLINEAHSAASTQAFQKMADAINAGREPNEGLHELIIGGYQRRAQVRTLTGEWIIYAKDNDGQNYFLTLAQHFECEQRPGETGVERQRRSDTIIHQRILECRPDFPNLVL